MQIVLNEDVKNLGYRGDIVIVKPGYFRNYLWPNGMADLATASRLKVANSRKEKVVMHKEQLVANAKDVIKKLSGLVINLKEKVNAKGHLYAAVSEKEVIDAIEKASKIKLTKDLIEMDHHIKEVGEYKVKVMLGEGVEDEVTVKVEAA